MPRPFRSVWGRREEAVATYAAVLDGVHLWLDVDGPAAARALDGGGTTDLGEAPYDLTRLTGTTYEVLVDRSPVTLAGPQERPLSRTPFAPDGTSRWEVVRAEDGRLRLTRTAEPETAELAAVDVRGDRLHLRIRPPDAVERGSHLLLLDTDDQLLETLPMTAHDGSLETLIGVDDLPAGYFGILRLAVGTEESWVRIRRRANDLADPNHAVLLPELFDDGPGGGVDELGAARARARLRWNPDGLLALRSIDPDEAG